jgi:hypothetical protein
MVFKLILSIKKKVWIASGLVITEVGTIEEDSEVANNNKDVVEEEDINPKVDRTL